MFPVRSTATHLALSLLFAVPAWALPPGVQSLDAAPGVVGGVRAGESLGATLALLGDLDGDGLADYAIGAPDAGEGAGRVYLLAGADLLEGAFVQLPAAGVLVGGGGDRFGASLVAAGDLDGDGIGDLAVGAPGYPGGDSPEGRVYLFRGGPGLLAGDASVSDAMAILDGPEPGARLGEVLMNHGDATGDGRADLALVVRDAGLQSTSGRVVVVPGRPAGGWGLTTSLSARTGWSFTVEQLGDGPTDGPALAAAGDVDGDGLDDLYLGRPADSTAAARGGGLLLLPGGGEGELDAEEAALTTLHGGEPGERLGRPLVVDRATGRLWAGFEGAAVGGAWAFDGGALSEPAARLLGVGAGGLRVLTGDVDGEGRVGPIAVQSRAEGPFLGGDLSGGLGVFFDSPDAESDLEAADAVFWGPGGAEAGAAAAITDLEGDGYDDLLIGAPGANETGLVYVLRGAALADGDGFTPLMGDCDDLSAAVHPAMDEICDDSLDNDCNGFVDGLDAPCALADAGVTVSCSAGGGGGLLGLLLLLLVRSRHRALLLLPLLAACGTAQVAEEISVVIVGPEPARVEGLHLPVEVAVEGARLAPEEPPVEGPLQPVRWRLTVDGVERAVTGGALFVVSGLDPGVHSVDVELLEAATGAPFEPPIVDSLTVEVVTLMPAVSIEAPAADAILAPEPFEVSYSVQGITLDEGSVGGANQAGVGHAVITLDGVLQSRDADGRADVVPPGEGTFELAVEIVQNDGSPMEPAVIDRRPVTIAEPGVVITAPAAGATVVGPGVTVDYEVIGFRLDPDNLNGGSPTPGVGHVHVYLDGLYTGLDADGTIDLPDVDGCAHEVALVLATVDHAEVGELAFVEFDYEPCVFVEGLADGSQVVGDEVTVPIVTAGFDLEGEDAAGPVGRHVHAYVDGQFEGDVTGDSVTFTALTPGDRVLELRLADEALAPGALLPGDQELEPRASTRVVVTVLGV